MTLFEDDNNNLIINSDDEDHFQQQESILSSNYIKVLISFASLSAIIISILSFFINSDTTISELRYKYHIRLHYFKVSLFNRLPFLRKLDLNATLLALLVLAGSVLLTENSISRSLMSYFNNKPSNGFSRSRPSLLNRRRYRNNNNVDEETINTVLENGGFVGGLVNDGNTCFMNSVIQSLSSSATLQEYLLDENIHSDGKEFIFSKTLKKLLDRLNSKHYNNGKDYRTDPLLKTMTKTPNKSFLMGYNQEDAQEFFQSILHELEEDFKKITPKADSTKAIPVSDIPSHSNFGSDNLGSLGPVYIPAFQIDPNLESVDSKYFKYQLLTPLDGLSAERIGCLRCGEMGGIRYSVISGLSLNLPPDNYTAIKLRDLLKEWIKPEIIEGVDCNRCALNSVVTYQQAEIEKLKESGSSQKLIDLYKARIEEIEKELEKPIIDDEIFKKLHTKNMVTKTSKSKQILISRPPPLLSIHVNRSVFDPMTYRVRKNNARVVFPIDLDLNRFVADVENVNTDGRLPLSKKVFDDEEEDEDELEEEEQQPIEDSDDYEDISENEDDEDNELEDEERLIEHEKLEGDEEEKDENEEPVKEEEQESISTESNSEEPVTPPSSIEYVNSQLQSLSGPLVYTLRSVIVHYGTHNYGHYIAYRKARGVWWRISDEDVEIVSEDEVVSTQGVFMLFYELKNLVGDIDKKLEQQEARQEDQDVEITGEKESLREAEDEDTTAVGAEEEEEEEVKNTAFQFANL